MKKDNIAIISIYSFPNGLAPTSRIKAYSKGMIEAGANVKVYMPFPTDSNTITQLPKCGNEFGILYEYTSGRYKSKIKLFRGLATYTKYRCLVGIISSFYTILRDSKQEKIDTLIISSDALDMLCLYPILAKCINAKSIFIFDEYPIPIRHKLKEQIPVWKSWMYKKILKGLDAYISISENLRDYYCRMCEKQSLILSSITDTDRFDIVVPELNKKYFCYMGNMELSKDNVDLIIKAYSFLSEAIQNEYKLHLYGTPSAANKKTLLNLINELQLQEKVLFKGRASFSEVPSILVGASLLVSSQPDTLRAQGGFPTKLGEYLASGTPTLLTDVGENAKFVQHKKEVFFAVANSIEDYTTKIEYIVNNYDEALQVAQNGKKYVEDGFSHIQQGKYMLNFIKSLD